MKRISLIANSSLQYYKFETEINLDFGKNNKIYFHEPFDTLSLNFILDPLIKNNNGEENCYRYQELIDNDFIINEKIKQEADLSQLESIQVFYEENNLKKA